MGKARDPKKVKSAQRTLEVLEFFNAERQQATVMEIARHLGYPQSSTSELLSCLVSLGYLHHDRYARSYRPSSRVAVLGAWVQPRLFRQGRLLPMMDELADATGLSVVIAIKVELQVRHVHTVSASGCTLDLTRMASSPLLRSALGKMLLCSHDRDMVRRFSHRLNAESAPDERVVVQDLLQQLKQIRAQGYAVEQESEDTSAIAVLLPQASPHEQLAVALYGAPEAVQAQQDKLLQTLRGVVARYLAPVPAGANLSLVSNSKADEALSRVS